MLLLLPMVFAYPYPSCASRPDLALWHLSHMLCQLLLSQNSPPSLTGWMWSTTLASLSHTTHVGCFLMYASRARRHAPDQYRLSCGRSRCCFFLRGSGVCLRGIVGIRIDDVARQRVQFLVDSSHACSVLCCVVSQQYSPPCVSQLCYMPLLYRFAH